MKGLMELGSSPKRSQSFSGVGSPEWAYSAWYLKDCKTTVNCCCDEEMLVTSEALLCLCLLTQSCPTVYHPTDCSPSRSSVHGDSPGKNTGMGFHALLQGIFPTQGSKHGSFSSPALLGVFFVCLFVLFFTTRVT